MTDQAPMEEISDWGVPDWREADQYPATDSLTHRQWRWQFLRRRPEFREEWQAGVRDGKLWFDTVMTGDPERCKREYGTVTVFDPRRDYNDGALYQRFTRVNTAVEGVSYELSERWTESGLALFRFDLTQALRPQITKAEVGLKALQKERFGTKNTPKPKRGNWPLYLRALDAKDAGASYDLMARTFWPDDFDKKTAQSARDVYKAAAALRNIFPA